MCFKVLGIIERIINYNNIIVAVIIILIITVWISFSLDCSHCAKKSALCLNNKVQRQAGKAVLFYSILLVIRNDTLTPPLRKNREPKIRKVGTQFLMGIPWTLYRPRRNPGKKNKKKYISFLPPVYCWAVEFGSKRLNLVPFRVSTNTHTRNYRRRHPFAMKPIANERK